MDPIYIEADPEKLMEDLTDSERVKWIKCLAAGCLCEGTIDKIREAVNDPALDD